MGILNSNLAACGHVEKYIGTSYDVVRAVQENMDNINAVAGCINDGTCDEILALGNELVLAAGLINYKGLWDQNINYKLGDSVKYMDAFWIANADNIGSEPIDGNDNWASFISGDLDVVEYIADLPETPLGVELYRVKHFSTFGDGGGGVLYWDPDMAKSEANLGTIVDMTVALTQDAQGSGVGIGCWVRDYLGGASLRWFGAKADDPTSDANVILHKALVSTSKINIDGTFYINSAITTSYDHGIHIEGIYGKGKFITAEGANQYFMVTPTASTTLNSVVLARDSSFQVSNPDGFAVGQMITLFSDQIGESQWNTPKRDIGFITAISGTTISVGFDLNFDYDPGTSTTTVDVYEKHGFSFRNISMENDNAGSIHAHYFSNVLYENIFQVGINITSGWGMVPQWCCNVKIANIHSENMLYPVMANCSRYVYMENISGISCHHLIDAAAFTTNVHARNISGSHCQGIIGFHPSFDVHVNGVLADNEISSLAFRTWGGSLSNVRITLSDDITEEIPQYMQSLAVANATVNPYEYSPVAYSNVVMVPNSSGIYLGLQADVHQDCLISDCSVYKISAENTNGNGGMQISNCKLEWVHARGNYFNMVNCTFEAINHTDHAISTVHLGLDKGLFMQVSNCTFHGYDKVVHAQLNTYAMSAWIACDFRNILELMNCNHVDNTNYHFQMSCCAFNEVTSFSNHTDQFNGFDFSQCIAYDNTPALPAP